MYPGLSVKAPSTATDLKKSFVSAFNYSCTEIRDLNNLVTIFQKSGVEQVVGETTDIKATNRCGLESKTSR